MTLFRLWVSRDGYYISEAEAREMIGEVRPWIVRPILSTRRSIFAPEEDLSVSLVYERREFGYRQIATPDGGTAETLKIAIAAGASLLISGEKLQPYRYGEMSEYDWQRIDRGLKTP